MGCWHEIRKDSKLFCDRSYHVDCGMQRGATFTVSSDSITLSKCWVHSDKSESHDQEEDVNMGADDELYNMSSEEEIEQAGTSERGVNNATNVSSSAVIENAENNSSSSIPSTSVCGASGLVSTAVNVDTVSKIAEVSMMGNGAVDNERAGPSESGGNSVDNATVISSFAGMGNDKIDSTKLIPGTSASDASAKPVSPSTVSNIAEACGQFHISVQGHERASVLSVETNVIEENVDMDASNISCNTDGSDVVCVAEYFYGTETELAQATNIKKDPNELDENCDLDANVSCSTDDSDVVCVAEYLYGTENELAQATNIKQED